MPGTTGHHPEVTSERSVLRGTWMKAIGGQPAAAAVGPPTNLGDVRIPETAGGGFGPGNVLERVDSGAKRPGRAKGGRSRQRRDVGRRAREHPLCTRTKLD